MYLNIIFKCYIFNNEIGIPLAIFFVDSITIKTTAQNNNRKATLAWKKKFVFMQAVTSQIDIKADKQID